MLNTSQLSDHEQLLHETQLNLLRRIGEASTPASVLKLAEAYAWITSPGEPHGGATDVDVSR